MLQKNTFSPFRKPELSSLHALPFIFILALILFISTTNVYSAQVTLAWNPNTEPDLAGHNIYSGPSSGNYDSVINVGNQTSYTIQNLVEGQKYYITVTAYDSWNNESDYSAEVVYNVPILDLTAPSTPTSLQATTISTSQINLSWNTSSDNIGVTGYRIYRDSTQIATTSNTTYQDTGLSSSTTYSYTVSAYDAAGNESGQSSASSATTLSLPVNNPPVLDSISDIFVSEGATITLNPAATDPDGDALTYTYSGWMTSSSYTTNYNDSGTHAVTVTVSDGILTDSQVVTVIVLNGNNNSAPVLDPITDITVTEGATVTLNPAATDPDGDALTYTYSGWMTSASYTTNYDDAGIHTVTVTVSDGSLTDFQDVTITVNDDPNQVTSGIPVTWVDTVGVIVNANSLTKNAPTTWGNSGAASLESFTGDGGVEFTATQTNTFRMCGLSSTNPDANYASIEYAIYNAGAGIHVYERGSYKGYFGTYQVGDIFMVERVGSTIVYKKNNVIFHTSVTPTDAALLVDCAIESNGGEISDVKLIGITDIGGGPTDTTPPSTPNSLQATAISVSQVDLSWSASTDSTGVTGYRIFRDGTELTTTTATTYSDTGLSASTTYSYTVAAYDAAANESNQSSSVSVTTLSLPVNNPPTLNPIANVALNEGETVTLNPTATGQDGDALTYTYSGWMTSSTYTTNYTDAGVYTVTVTVSDGSLTDSQDVTITVNDDPNQVTSGIPVTWVDTVGVIVNGNSITSTATGWGNSGAASLESFTGDGGVEFTATQTNTFRMCGLSSTNPDANYASIEYAIYNAGAGIHVYERGSYKGYFGTYQIGDSFKVERIGSTIVYKKNNVTFRTALTPTDLTLFVDCTIESNGGEISDVRLIGTANIDSGPTQTATLINIGDTWKYFKGYSNPGSGWNDTFFGDSYWLEGPIGLGYGDGDDATVLSDMRYNYLTVYTRKTFNISDPSTITDMLLNIDYDDGFVAYINGQEVARANMPGGMPDYYTAAVANHPAGTQAKGYVDPEEFDLTSYIGNLVTGTNVLAIEIHNQTIDSYDLSMIPELQIVGQ